MCQHFPNIKDATEATEERYNSIVEFNKATLEDFAGLVGVVYQAHGGLCFKNVPISNNLKGDAASHSDWLSALKLPVDNGLVPKEVDGKDQIGKVIKQGARWKWVPLPGLKF